MKIQGNIRFEMKNSLKDRGGSYWWKDEKIWVNSLRQFGYIRRKATDGPVEKNELSQGRGKQKTNINRSNKKMTCLLRTIKEVAKIMTSNRIEWLQQIW